jgi:hypothetical protein
VFTSKSPHDTTLQSESQLADSPLSSQSSPGSTTPFPQLSSWQVELHPSPLTVPPSSQVSPAAVFTMPSPQDENVHVAVHPAV